MAANPKQGLDLDEVRKVLRQLVELCILCGAPEYDIEEARFTSNGLKFAVEIPVKRESYGG